MLLFAKAKIKVDKAGQVTVKGAWEKHRVNITHFCEELGLKDATVTLTGSGFRFSGSISAATQQRIRNFLVNECRGSR
jgi:hypothetical protein